MLRVTVRKERMRINTRTLAITASLLVAGGALTGCTQASEAADTCVSPFSSGALSQNITVLGGFEEEPVVTIPQGFSFADAQAHTVVRADDRSQTITERSVAMVNYALVESATGTVLESSADFTNGQGNDIVLVDPEAEQGVFPGALACAAPGDRLVLTLSSDEAAMYSASIGAPADTALAVLVDVHSVQPVALQGSTKQLPSGFPGVVVDETGQPGVVTAPGNEPQTTRIATRVEGEGAQISADDLLIGNVLQVSWAGDLIENTHTTSPTWLGSEDSDDAPFREYLTGVTIGSQVVIIAPDEAHGAVIYVVDVLAAV